MAYRVGENGAGPKAGPWRLPVMPVIAMIGVMAVIMPMVVIGPRVHGRDRRERADEKADRKDR